MEVAEADIVVRIVNMKNKRDMIKTNFQEFVNEKYTLTIEDSMDDFEMPDKMQWELEYNVTDIWNKYQQNKNDKEFLKNYKDRLLGKKDKLASVGKDCWNDLVGIVKENTKDNMLPYLDKIYDWADKYGIKITSGKSENK